MKTIIHVNQYKNNIKNNFQKLLDEIVMSEPVVIDTIEVTQDIGHFEPRMMRVTLELLSDNSVRWTSISRDEGF